MVEPGVKPEEDTTPPEIQVLRPDGKFVFVMRPRITFKGTADDNRKIERVTWSNNRGGSGTAEGTTKWRVENLRLKRWMNEITFTAYDAAGNRSSVKVKVFAWFWR